MPASSFLHRRSAIWRCTLIICAAWLTSCHIESRIVADKEDGSILVLGDSVMEWNKEEDAAIADVIAAELGRAVVNAGVSGARLSMPEDEANLGALGFDIRAQYRARGWEWVVMDGGANDLGDECGCGQCAATLNEMIGADGLTGQYPDFVRSVRADGSRVLLMGYYAAPQGADTAFTPCIDELTALNDRLAQMAAALDGVYYASATEAIDPADRTHYDRDLVHPSAEGSRLIGLQLAQAIRAAEGE